MSFQATALQVFIASPSDLPKERIIVADQINIWNRDHAASQALVFVPLAWEWAVATQGYGGQEQINRQQVNQADVVIAMFKAKLGSPTVNHPSGTAEEIAVATGRGLPVSILLCQKPAGPDVYYGAEYDRLKKYIEKIRTEGLTQTFREDSELRILIDRILWRASNDHKAVRPAPRADVVVDPPPDAGNAGTLREDVYDHPSEDDPLTDPEYLRRQRVEEYLASHPPVRFELTEVRRLWPEIIARVSAEKRVTAAMLQMATVVALEGDTLILGVTKEPLAYRLLEPKNLQIIVEALTATFIDLGDPIRPPLEVAVRLLG